MIKYFAHLRPICCLPEWFLMTGSVDMEKKKTKTKKNVNLAVAIKAELLTRQDGEGTAVGDGRKAACAPCDGVTVKTV